MSDKLPVKKIRIGNVQVAVWENQKEGKFFYPVTCKKSYKDKNDEWQDTGSFGINDLPKLSMGIMKAYEWLLTRNQDKISEERV